MRCGDRPPTDLELHLAGHKRDAAQAVKLIELGIQQALDGEAFMIYLNAASRLMYKAAELPAHMLEPDVERGFNRVPPAPNDDD